MIHAIDRYIGAVLALVILAGLLLAWMPSQLDGTPAPLALPAAVGPWRTSGSGVQETILPRDPRATDTVRRAYTDGRDTVWLSIASYPATNDPQTRPTIVRIASEAGSAFITRSIKAVSFNGHPGRGEKVNHLLVHHPIQQRSILYWYLLDGTVVTSEYELRLRLFLNTLLARRPPLFLVRIASDSSEAPESFIHALAAFWSALSNHKQQ